MSSTSAVPAAPPRSLAAEYRTLPNVSDELMDSAGNIRPVWTALTNQLSRLSEAEIAARFARADQYLRDAGV